MTTRSAVRWAAMSAAILVALGEHPASAEPRSHSAMVQATIATHVLPRFEAFRDAAQKLPAAVDASCNGADDRAVDALHRDFRGAVLAYAAIDYLRFGPMIVDGRRERLSFWPDPRGFVARQLRQLVASNDASRATPAAIAEASAAIEGLPALEALIFDAASPLGPGPDAQYRCAVAGAIARNIASIAALTLDDWTKPGGWRDKMLRPGSDNDTYKEPQEAASELVKALLTGLALVSDVQIKPRLDGRALAVGPYAKAGLTSEFYRAEVASLRDLYLALDLEAYLGPDGEWVRKWAANAWRTMRASDGLGGLSADADLGYTPGLREVFDKITGLRKLATREMSAAGGLTFGFNELDGD